MDIFIGKVLRTFQDLSEDNKAPYVTVQDKLLTSQNQTAEHYRQHLITVCPAPEQNFSDYVSSVKMTFDRWLHLSHVSDLQRLYDLMIKIKFLMSSNANYVAFLIEKDHIALIDLTGLEYQYYAAHPMSKIQNEVPFPGFCLQRWLRDSR